MAGVVGATPDDVESASSRLTNLSDDELIVYAGFASINPGGEFATFDNDSWGQARDAARTILEQVWMAVKDHMCANLDLYSGAVGSQSILEMFRLIEPHISQDAPLGVGVALALYLSRRGATRLCDEGV